MSRFNKLPIDSPIFRHSLIATFAPNKSPRRPHLQPTVDSPPPFSQLHPPQCSGTLVKSWLVVSFLARRKTKQEKKKAFSIRTVQYMMHGA
ncbi:hypothetical protein AFLA_007527 [Aspergillus flavus NRRL3357]|nr:hypothetical protein AFLA_007527 [Aspergillus flavus NRRL3357]